MRTQLMLITLIAVTFRYAEARDYPIPFPYRIDGLEELKALVFKKKRHISTDSQENNLERKRYMSIDSQEINLGNELKIIGFFQSYGSGIETINAYIYTCEDKDCELFAFLRTWASKVTMGLVNNNQEMILKSHDGTIIFRTPFPYGIR